MPRIRTAAAVTRLIPIYLALGVAKRIVPLPRLVRWMSRRRGAGRREHASTIVSRVLRASALAGVPDRDCVQRSLLLLRELSSAGFSPELSIGLRREGDRLSGHAWVTVDGQVVAEPEPDLSAFVQIVKPGRPVLIVEELDA